MLNVKKGNESEIEPSEIIYSKDGKETSLNVLQYNGTYVWGKPFYLSSENSGTTVTVTRNSSPYNHSSTGEIPSGWTYIHYGDNLSIKCSANTHYKDPIMKINGVNSGTETTKTVTEGIKIVASATYVPYWHIVFSGSKEWQSSGRVGSKEHYQGGIDHRAQQFWIKYYHKDDEGRSDKYHEAYFTTTGSFNCNSITYPVNSIHIEASYERNSNRIKFTLTSKAWGEPWMVVTDIQEFW